ncbi:MAG: GNAT family N-acetyltransferase, partial [Firmicutes bacterium]|nr:GNAT family N-acetyltransferase [Bacillota bacterium]
EGYVYLSLLIISKDYRNKGLGKEIYQCFESKVCGAGASKIRIDVVDDYESNVIPFWEKMGFNKARKDELTWGEKTSSVAVMEKNL